jgi:hypothetical protein
MDDRGKQYLRSADGVVTCIDELLGSLRRFKKAVSSQARRIEAGMPAVDALESVNATTIRQELVDAFDNFETLRHQMRVALIALALEEEASLSDVARALGVSRQLVSRIARDIDMV